MTRTPGRPSSPAPKREGDKNLTRDALVVLGILASFGLIAASAVLNFRMGYRSADTELDGMVYGSAAALGDGLKAVVPFVGGWGYRNRDHVALVAAVLLFTVLTAYSFSAGLGFSAQHRATKEALTSRSMEQHADLRSEIDRNSKRLEQLGPQRTPEEVEQAIANLLKAPVGKGRYTVGDVSEECTRNLAGTRTTCGKVGVLKEELARALDARRLAADNKGLLKALGQVKGGTTSSADPQIDALAYLARLIGVLPMPGTPEEDAEQHRRIGFMLSVVMALFMELGSGLGLYLSTTPWRAREKPTLKKPDQPDVAVAVVATRNTVVDVDELETYVLDRLEPHPRAVLPLRDLYADYKVWCGANKKAPFQKPLFERLFGAVARAAGIVGTRRGGELVYRDVRLVGKPVVVEFQGAVATD